MRLFISIKIVREHFAMKREYFNISQKDVKNRKDKMLQKEDCNFRYLSKVSKLSKFYVKT